MSNPVLSWAGEAGSGGHYIAPGQMPYNGAVESFSVRNPKAFAAERYARLVFQLATPWSSALVSVSGSTQALLGRLGLSSTVVYNTVSGFVAAAAAGPAKRQGRYMPHRNTERVLEAFARARAALPDVQLKVLGAP